MSLPLVCVVILNWNRAKDTAECVASVLQMDYPNCRVIVVDNGSTDGTPEKLHASFPAIDVIVNATNLGFAAGNNVGIEFALRHEAGYVFLLNNDTVVDKALLRELVNVGEANSQAGVLGPKIYYHDDPDRIWFVGADRNPLAFTVINWALGKKDRGQFDQIRKVDFICGAGMLVKREVWERIGLLDPSYFMYYEDSDFCVRAKMAGYTLLSAPKAYMWHKVPINRQGEMSPTKVYDRARSGMRFFRKHTKGVHFGLVLLLRLGYAGYQMVVETLRGNGRIVGPYVKGLYEGLVETVPSSGNTHRGSAADAGLAEGRPWKK